MTRDILCGSQSLEEQGRLAKRKGGPKMKGRDDASLQSMRLSCCVIDMIDHLDL